MSFQQLQEGLMVFTKKFLNLYDQQERETLLNAPKVSPQLSALNLL